MKKHKSVSLDEIVKHKYTEVEERKKRTSLDELKNRLHGVKNLRNFEDAITRREKKGLRLIAEIKKASPSKGVLREKFSPVEIAKIYEQSGASAISVLTDEKFFMGSLEYLNQVSTVTTLPLLCKDFIVDPYQIYEAKTCGANAVLLIVAVLNKKVVKEFIRVSDQLGLSSLVEVHNEDELEIAQECGSRIIGINNRNLKTFNVDLNICEKLCSRIATGTRIVVESGILTRSDVERVSHLPVDAILVGEALMKQDDASGKIKELLGLS